jgi:hypothetical protein
MRFVWMLLAMMLLASCQSFAGNEEDIAYEAELEAFGTEAAFLRDQMQIDRTAIAATVQVGGTQVVAFTEYNMQLAATIQSGITPTATLGSFDMTLGGAMSVDMFDLSSGEMRFVQVGTTSQINPDDGCFVSRQNFFDNDMTFVIYMTALALNLQAGTVVRVDWQYGGEVVYSNAWTAPQSLDGQCIALEIRPSNAPFLPGNWTATMVINGEPIDPAPFTIIQD